MPRSITIVTPENITVTYELAGVASRFLAFVIDLIIQVLLWLGTSWFFHVAAAGFQSLGVNLTDLFAAANLIFALMIIPFAYASIFEML